MKTAPTSKVTTQVWTTSLILLYKCCSEINQVQKSYRIVFFATFRLRSFSNSDLHLDDLSEVKRLLYCRMSVMWCATYGGHLHFVELSDSWSYVAAERLDNDKATLVVRQAQFASSTVLHCANRLPRIHSERRRLVAVLLWQLYTTS